MKYAKEFFSGMGGPFTVIMIIAMGIIKQV